MEYQKYKKQNIQKIVELNAQISRLKQMLEDLSDNYRYQERQSVNLEEMLARERKERSLMAVPSLEDISQNVESKQESSNDIYAMLIKK